MRWRESWRADPAGRRIAKAARFYWEPPPQGIITFIDPTKTKHKRDPGRCFRKAGFHVSGKASAEGNTRPVCICDGKPPPDRGRPCGAPHGELEVSSGMFAAGGAG